MTLINNNMSFKGTYKLVIPDDQKEKIKDYMNKHLSEEDIAKFNTELDEVKQYAIKRLPPDDVVEFTLGRYKEKLGIKLASLPFSLIPGAFDWIEVKMKYVPGERSKKLGMTEWIKNRESEETFKHIFDFNIIGQFEKFTEKKTVQKKLITDDDSVKPAKEELIDKFLNQ